MIMKLSLKVLAYTRIIHSAIERHQISALDANKRFIIYYAINW